MNSDRRLRERERVHPDDDPGRGGRLFLTVLYSSLFTAGIVVGVVLAVALT